jgi:hypothetical protein
MALTTQNYFAGARIDGGIIVLSNMSALAMPLSGGACSR